MDTKKVFKIIVAILMLGIGIFIYSSIYGNPIGYINAKNKIQNYIEVNYKNKLKINELNYNWKMNGYTATVEDIDDLRNTASINYHNTGYISDYYYFRTKENMCNEVQNVLVSFIEQQTNLKKHNMTLTIDMDLPKFKYKISDNYSGKENINIDLNLHEGSETLYESKEEFSKEVYSILNVLKNTKYKYDSIEIYSYLEDGNNTYKLNINKNIDINSIEDLNNRVYIENNEK